MYNATVFEGKKENSAHSPGPCDVSLQPFAVVITERQ